MEYYKYELGTLLRGLLSLILLATCADAATLNVPADYTTIQAAVNAAAAGDTILVQSGTYCSITLILQFLIMPLEFVSGIVLFKLPSNSCSI